MSVSLFVYLCPNSSDIDESIEFRFSGNILLGLQVVYRLWNSTVCQKTVKTIYFSITIFSSFSCTLIEVNFRYWNKTTKIHYNFVVAKPLVVYIHRAINVTMKLHFEWNLRHCIVRVPAKYTPTSLHAYIHKITFFHQKNCFNSLP